MIDEQRLIEIEARAAVTPWPPVWNEVKVAIEQDIPDLLAALREAKERIAQLEDAAEAMVHWCSKRDQWWDEAVILADVLGDKPKPSDPRAPGGIGWDGGPGPGPGE